MIRARILSFIAWLVVSVWSRTVSLRFVNAGVPERLRTEERNFIYAFWHGSMFLLLRAQQGSGIVIPVSESADGDIMAGVLGRFGYGIVRGSSSRNGHKALLKMVCGVRKGQTIGVAVDGPRGPIHQAKKGAAFLAGKMNIPIIPVVSAARRAMVVESTWEKLVLPLPFTTGLILFGEPVHVNGSSEEAIESGRRRLEQVLHNLSLEAQELAGDEASTDLSNRLTFPAPERKA